jgi:hypothetical protein
MPFKPAGAPCELWAENVRLNPASFGVNVSDDWEYSARVDNTPARLGHSADKTAYAGNGPAEDDWIPGRFYGTLSPAKVQSGSTGSTRGGQLT